MRSFVAAGSMGSLPALAVALVLGGCASSSSDESELSKDALYEQTVPQDKLVVAAASEYFRRTVLAVTSDRITPGIYAPSQVLGSAGTECADDGTISRLNDAINRDDVVQFQSAPTIGPFAKLPREVGYLERRNNEARNGFPAGPIVSQSTSSRERPACYGVPQVDACMQTQVKPDTAAPNDIQDLDYIILVSESDQAHCDDLRRQDDDLQPRSKDLMKIAGEKEARTRTGELAAAAYTSSDMLRLIRVLPRRHRGSDDRSLELPELMTAAVRTIFASVSSDVHKAYRTLVTPSPSLTFDRVDLLGSRFEDYGAWFQGLAVLGGDKIYLSPLLARAPFYTCYNNGVYQYVESRYRLIEKLSRPSDAGWRSVPRDEVVMLARGQLRYEEDYKNCVRAQFYFVMSHEIAHLIRPTPNLDDAGIELFADCFGYIHTRRSTDYDLGIFSPLILAGEGDAPAGLRLRRTALQRLEEQMDAKGLPGIGKKTLDFCEAHAKLRPGER